MADVSDPLLSHDADVTGSGATLNDNTMDVDIEVLSDGENIRRVSRSSTLMQSPASALSNLLSMIEYATKPVLTDIAKCHNVQLPLETNREVLRTLIASHLSNGDCANLDADGCRQVITSFYIKSDVLSVLTKFTFQIQILSLILYLVRLRPLRRILSCLHVFTESDMSFTKLRSELRKFITRLKHAKRSEDARNSNIAQDEQLKEEREKI